MADRGHRRSLRNLLLDRRFQLKYALAIALSGGLIFGGLGLLVDQKVRHNTELAAMDGDPDPFEAELKARMSDEDQELRWTLLAAWLATVGLLFAVGIAATHKIVGPVYVVQRHLGDLAAGKAIHLRPLRQGDEFQQLFRQVGVLARQLEGERRGTAEAIERALQTFEARLASAEGALDPARVMGWLREDLGPLMGLASQQRQASDPEASRDG
ncbi:MAG: hypothetical protein KC613_19315 [Myxococcales bacterium]|nr:hypothetical protein [Myxococcales bacterium]MCB9525865.1 hypothetical protein [Myxococcales bacterium]